MPPTPAEIAGYFNWKVEYGVYPVYVGSVGVQYVSPAVWSVTLSAAPEPSSAILCLVAATMFGLLRAHHRPDSFVSGWAAPAQEQGPKGSFTIRSVAVSGTLCTKKLISGVTGW